MSFRVSLKNKHRELRFINVKYIKICSLFSAAFLLPVSFCGIREHEVPSGDCARISQSPVGRRGQSGCRSVGMMGDSEANSLNRTCVGTSLGSLLSPETQTYEAGSCFFNLNAWEDMKGNVLFIPGRADFSGMGLTVFLRTLWATALFTQRTDHYAKHIHTLNKYWRNYRNGTWQSIRCRGNLIFTCFQEQQEYK